MTHQRMPLPLIGLSLAVFLSGGCSSPDTRFYVLSDVAATTRLAAGVEQDVAVGLGPVELPEYLDRPQIVTRTDQNELQLAEFDKWAEPLKDNVSQVLAENLRILLPSNKVVVYPWKRATSINYQAVVKITRFDHTVDGESVLSARWSILSGDGANTLATQESRYAQRPKEASYRATVAAMNQTLERFSQDVADKINELNKEPISSGRTR